MTKEDFLRKHWPVTAALVLLLVILGITLRPYGWNPSALIHTDEVMHAVHPLPDNFVVLQVPAYDGAQYYQIARDMKKIFTPDSWPALAEKSTFGYAYQRFLLPLTVFIVSLGQEAVFPYVFAFINIVSLLLACVVILRWKRGSPLAALAFVFCPSAMVALHFSLAEPLALLLLALFLTRYSDRGRLTWVDVLLLSLLMLSREVNILFAGTILLYTLYKKHWKDAAMMLIPIGTFLALHSFIYAIFGNVPFLISAGANQIPGSAALKVLMGMRGYDIYTLSSVALLIGFVLPTFLWSGSQLIKGNRTFAATALFLFLCLMFTMPDYIWGSITSIGRVITPIYPLAIVAFAQSNNKVSRLLTFAIIAIGLGAGLGLALIEHPFFLS